MTSSFPHVAPILHAVSRADLPHAVVGALEADERVYFYVQPIRHALGRGVWMVMLLGVVFSVASMGAVTDTWLGVLETNAPQIWQHMSFGLTLGLTLVFVVFSTMLLAWPLLSHHAMRSTHVFISEHRIVELKERRAPRAPRIRSWNLLACPDAYVTRTRGKSASLVLSERVRERSTDGQTIYEWEAIHGIPRATEALGTLQALQKKKRAMEISL